MLTLFQRMVLGDSGRIPIIDIKWDIPFISDPRAPVTCIQQVCNLDIIITITDPDAEAQTGVLQLSTDGGNTWTTLMSTLISAVYTSTMTQVGSRWYRLKVVDSNNAPIYSNILKMTRTMEFDPDFYITSGSNNNGSQIYTFRVRNKPFNGYVSLTGHKNSPLTKNAKILDTIEGGTVLQVTQVFPEQNVRTKALSLGIGDYPSQFIATEFGTDQYNEVLITGRVSYGLTNAPASHTVEAYVELHIPAQEA